MTAAPDTPALLSGIRERASSITVEDLDRAVPAVREALESPRPPDYFAACIAEAALRTYHPIYRADVVALLAAIEALSTALQRHREWFTDSKGVMLCGGCLKPVPCPDDPDMIVERALSGKDSSDGEAL